MSLTTEQDLISAVQAGDRAALGDLLRQHEKRIYNVCLRMVSNRDDAAEVAQDAMLKIIQHIDRFRGDSQFTTWSTRIAMNQSISHLRKRKLRRTASLEASSNGQADCDGPMMRQRLADEREPGPLRCVEQEEMLDHLRAAMARLDDDFRAVLVLRDLEQLDYSQVAEALDVPVGTVKSRLFRARLALRQEMEKGRGQETGVRSQETGDRSQR